MSDRGYEFSAKSVEEAIEAGLRQLGMTRDSVNVEIVSRGSRGILGFGSEPALVRLAPLADTPPSVQEGADEEVPAAASDTAAAASDTAAPEVSEVEPEMQSPTGQSESVAAAEAIPASDAMSDSAHEATATAAGVEEEGGEAQDEDEELTGLAVELLAELIELMGFEADIAATWEPAMEVDGAPYLNLDIQGEDLGVLIGRRGETLANLQFLLRLMINQRVKSWQNIVVDVEQYKQRRVDQLTQLANRMAEQVATGGRSISLEPMPASERRIIHIALRDHPAVYTESTGEGDRRKISILPR